LSKRDSTVEIKGENVRLISGPSRFPMDRALIGGAQPIHGWWAPDALRYKKRSGARRHATLSSPCTHLTPQTLGHPIGFAQWRREAPLRHSPTPPSSVSAGGGPKDDGIYSATASTLSTWTPPDPLSPGTLMVETLTYLFLCFLV